MADRRPASRLRVERVRAGWRISDLATAFDIDEKTIWRLENGRTKRPRRKVRRALADALGVSECALFGEAGT